MLVMVMEKLDPKIIERTKLASVILEASSERLNVIKKMDLIMLSSQVVRLR